MRPTREHMLIDIAEVVAQRSTCSRAHVGVVIARDGRPLVTGYNGAPAGMPHCEHDCDCDPNYLMGGSAQLGRPMHRLECASKQPCSVAVHAEANAIAYAARWGISLEGAELYSTLVPCLPCAQLVINSGVTCVHYRVEYRDGRGLTLLQNAGIETHHWKR